MKPIPRLPRRLGEQQMPFYVPNSILIGVTDRHVGHVVNTDSFLKCSESLYHWSKNPLKAPRLGSDWTAKAGMTTQDSRPISSAGA